MSSISNRIPYVIGPDGGILTKEDLPPRNRGRWVPRRKAQIIAAVNGGLLSLADACTRYEISNEEYHAWLDAYERDGLSGLRVRRRPERASIANGLD
jgi:transposase-like protein